MSERGYWKGVLSGAMAAAVLMLGFDVGGCRNRQALQYQRRRAETEVPAPVDAPRAHGARRREEELRGAVSGRRGRYALPTPGEVAAVDPAAVQQFIARCYVPNEHWAGYSAVHAQRFITTMQLSMRFLRPGSKVLHVGDGQGYLPMLLHKFAGVTDQTSLDFLPLTSRYKDDEAGGRCACQLGTGTQAGRAWAYSIRAEKADFDSAAPWALPAGVHDVAFALEVAEHLWAGPQNFFLNVGRALKLGGVFVVTTPNSNSLTTLQRVLDGKNPFSYSPFRLNHGGDDEPTPRPEHVKEYSVTELDGAVRRRRPHRTRGVAALCADPLRLYSTLRRPAAPTLCADPLQRPRRRQFTHAGFNITVGTTISPYGHSVSAGLREAITGLAQTDAAKGRRGEVHYVVGAKVGCGTPRTRPCSAAWKPLYDYERDAPAVP